MSQGNRTPVLGDHKRVKSKLVTPFNDAFGPMREVSWINMMIPELLWIALVQQAWGPRRGVEIITAFTRDVRASDPMRDRTIWAAAGKFAALPHGVLAGIVRGRPYRDDLCGPLAPLHAHYPDNPMRELVSAVNGPPRLQDLRALKELVSELFDRASTSATMVQATATWLAFDAERLKVSAGLALADFPRIEDYPKTDLSQRIAVSIRATLNLMFGKPDLMASGTGWPVAFWDRGLELEPCERIEMTEASTVREDEEGIELWPLIETYCSDVDRELAARLDAWPPDFAQVHVHEVIGGMLAREATLAKDVARAPTLWTGHSAPILLRAMADVYINIAWLLLDPVERCRKFILFGLGQAKLELEHRRTQIGAREPTPQEVALLEASERWIDSQRIGWLLDVDLGKWSSLSVRQMAEEAGCIDFYNYVYTPLRLHPVQRLRAFDVAPRCAL